MDPPRITTREVADEVRQTLRQNRKNYDKAQKKEKKQRVQDVQRLMEMEKQYKELITNKKFGITTGTSPSFTKIRRRRIDLLSSSVPTGVRNITASSHETDFTPEPRQLQLAESVMDRPNPTISVEPMRRALETPVTPSEPSVDYEFENQLALIDEEINQLARSDSRSIDSQNYELANLDDDRDAPRAVHNTRIKAMNEFQNSAALLQQGKDHKARSQKSNSYMIESYKGDDRQSKASKRIPPRRSKKEQDSRRSSNRYSKADKEIGSIVKFEERIPGTIGGIPDALKPSEGKTDSVRIKRNENYSHKRGSSMKSSVISGMYNDDLESEIQSYASKNVSPVPRVRQDILKIRHETGQSSRHHDELRSLRQETPASLLASYGKEKSKAAEPSLLASYSTEKQVAEQQRSFAINEKKSAKTSSVLQQVGRSSVRGDKDSVASSRAPKPKFHRSSLPPASISSTPRHSKHENYRTVSQSVKKGGPTPVQDESLSLTQHNLDYLEESNSDLTKTLEVAKSGLAVVNAGRVDISAEAIQQNLVSAMAPQNMSQSQPQRLGLQQTRLHAKNTQLTSFTGTRDEDDSHYLETMDKVPALNQS